jgi:hypothetical protein
MYMLAQANRSACSPICHLWAFACASINVRIQTPWIAMGRKLGLVPKLVVYGRTGPQDAQAHRISVFHWTGSSLFH